jgi:periplasmic protein CpxP/Spy
MTTKGRTTMMAAAALAALSWTAAITMAQEPSGPAHPHGDRGFGPGGPGAMGGGLWRLADRLGLSDDQKAQMKALFLKQKDTLQPLMENERTAREAFHKVLEAEGPDPATVGQAALAMHAADLKLQAAHQAAFEEFKALLTPDQRTQLDQMKARHGQGGPMGRFDRAPEQP